MFGQILGIITTVLVEIPKVLNLVEKVTTIFKPNATGDEKHSLAVELSKDAILQIEGFSGKEIIDENRFSSGLDKVIGGVNDMLHAVGVFKSKIV